MTPEERPSSQKMNIFLSCCCSSNFRDFSEFFPYNYDGDYDSDILKEVMWDLHQKGRFVTEDECKEIKEINEKCTARDSFRLLSLVLCMKTKKQIEAASKVLEGHISQLGVAQKAQSDLQVLSELYERRVITSKDIHCMKEMKGDLMLRLIMIQSDKESNVVTETLVTMRRHSSSGSDETIVYPILGTLVQNGLMSKEDIHKVQKNWDTRGWISGLSILCAIQSVKEHTVITRTVQIFEKYGFTGEGIAILKVLNELVQDGLVSKEDVYEVQKLLDAYSQRIGIKGICRIQCVKDHTVIVRTVDILRKYGCTTENVAVLKVLGELVQNGLMSKEDIHKVQKKWKAYTWNSVVSTICSIQSAKEHAVIARTVDILEKCGFTGEDIAALKDFAIVDHNDLMFQEDSCIVQNPKKGVTEEMETFEAGLITAAIERGGSVEVEIVKCVTLGPPAAGKTQLKKALSGDIEEATESTPVSTAAEVVMECFVDGKLKWEKFNETKLQSSLYRTVMWEEYDAHHNVFHSPQKAPLISDIAELHLSPPVIPEFNDTCPESTCTPILQKHISTLQHTQQTDLIQESYSFEDAFACVKERVLHNLSRTLGDEHLNKVRMIHMVDSGGQPAFFDFHPMVSTSRALYLIVYNSELGLSALPKITYRKSCQSPMKSLPNPSQTNLDMIKRSLHTLHHCKKKFLKMENELQKCLMEENDTLGLSNVLPVIIVGSRKNTCAQNSEEASKLLEFHCCNIPIWEDTQKYVSLVESLDPSCSGVKELRQAVSDAESKFKIRFPLLWFHCQLIFWSADDPRLCVMTYRDLHKLCTRHHLVSSKKEFVAMLTTFHMLGIFSCPDIDHIHVNPDNTDNLHSSPVFTNPGVLHQQVTRILQIPFHDLNCAGQKISFQQRKSLALLQKSGILTSDSLTLLGVPDTLGSFSGFHAYILKCLLNWGLAAEMPGDQLQLFMPSILPPRGDRKFTPSDQNNPIPPLALAIISDDSTDYCIPQGLFPHFVVNVMNNRSKGYDLKIGKGSATPRCRDVIAIVREAKAGTQYPYNIYAVDNIDHISIHITPAQKDEGTPKWSHADCGIIVEELENCTNRAYSKLYGQRDTSPVILASLCTACNLPVDKPHLAKLDKERLVMCCLSPENEGANEKVCSDIMKSILKGSKLTVTMVTSQTPQPSNTFDLEHLPSQQPQSLEFYSLSPSDVGLNGVLSDFPVWHFLAVSLGVPVIQVEAYRYDPLGGLLALQYWRDGRCEASYPSTWLFFLEKVRDTFGKKVAEDLEKKASKDPTWSQ